MADFARYLPLSYRPPQDESNVSSHWGGDIAAVLTAIADLLALEPDSVWTTPSQRSGWTIRESVGYLVWRLDVSTRELSRATSLAMLEHVFDPRAVADGFARRAASAPPVELIADLRRIAADKAAGIGRTGIRELAVATIGGLDVSHPLGAVLSVRPAASGAVALRRALSAPTEIKAVVRGRSLTATDAGWSFGRGPELADTAEAILLFLYGRSDRAPGAR